MNEMADILAGSHLAPEVQRNLFFGIREEKCAGRAVPADFPNGGGRAGDHRIHMDSAAQSPTVTKESCVYKLHHHTVRKFVDLHPPDRFGTEKHIAVLCSSAAGKNARKPELIVNCGAKTRSATVVLIPKAILVSAFDRF